jgi:hypothetical protein
MSEDLREYAPGELLKAVRRTWPGWLAIAIDAILYDTTTTARQSHDNGSIRAPWRVFLPMKHGGDCTYVDAVKVLRAARDVLEAHAFREVWKDQASWGEGRARALLWEDPKETVDAK